ncbi:MAG: hypothetical protein K0S04_3781 [Herbinix sp.]|jgi:hypothetical protein|nr:hypothetical protein [Herbinix sp.]
MIKLNNICIVVNYHIQLLLFEEFVSNIGNQTDQALGSQ